MKIFKTKNEWSEQRKAIANGTIGFVPTMGALHKGHISLIQKSLKENDFNVVSIFLNPTQFDNPNDLSGYPKLLENDIEILENLNVDFLFMPEFDYLYPDNFTYKVIETNFSKTLCGKHRPGHFTGVLTIVMKLFNIISPDKAYFGEKDYQQLLLVKGMTDAFFMDIEIVACPTVREENGLAMSSRNLKLSPEEREKAPVFYQLLKSDLSDAEVMENLKKQNIKVDYIETKAGRRFGAIFIGDVRLIDNVKK